MITDPVGRFGKANLALRDKAEKEGWDDDDFLRASERQFVLSVVQYLNALADGILNMSERRTE